MNKQTFKAVMELLDSRWPWGHNDQARTDYRNRLWARVVGWKSDYTRAFQSAVENVIATTARFGAGRPSVDEITSAVYRQMGGKGAIPVDDDLEGRRRRFSDLRAFLHQGWIPLDSSLAWIQSYVPEIKKEEVEEWWPLLVRKKVCPLCEAPHAVRVGSDKKLVHYFCPKCRGVDSAPVAQVQPGEGFSNPELFTDREWKEHKLRTSTPYAKVIERALAKACKPPF
jgi:Zn-finger nucleic acid-binding protein